jgi:hypothetical protein
VPLALPHASATLLHQPCPLLRGQGRIGRQAGQRELLEQRPVAVCLPADPALGGDRGHVLAIDVAVDQERRLHFRMQRAGRHPHAHVELLSGRAGLAAPHDDVALAQQPGDLARVRTDLALVARLYRRAGRVDLSQDVRPSQRKIREHDLPAANVGQPLLVAFPGVPLAVRPRVVLRAQRLEVLAAGLDVVGRPDDPSLFVP